MRIVLIMQIQDDEKKVLAEQSGFINTTEKQNTFGIITALKMWVGEAYCRLITQSIGKGSIH